MAEKKKTTKTKTTGQVYLSETERAKQRKKVRNNPGTLTKTQKAMKKAVTEARKKGKITPKKAGRVDAENFIGQAEAAQKKNPNKKNRGK